MKELKFGACLSIFGSFADRFCLSGYGEKKEFAQLFEGASRVKGLKGVELLGNKDITDNNVNEVRKYTDSYGLEVCMITIDLWAQAKWGKGTFTSKEPLIKRDAVSEVKTVMDIAVEVGCGKVNLWLGQDGYDYAFQADYQEAWKQLVECIRECADYRKDIRICLEYKIKEPRTHIFISNAPKAKLLVNEIDRDNVGVLMDIGHAAAAQENIAEAITILHNEKSKKLFYLHLNDNYGYWDDDMMFGSVHTIEALEMLYWLDRVEYDDYYTLDIFPSRENGIRAAEESIAWVNGLRRLLDRMGYGRIAEVISRGDPTESSSLLREVICG